MKDLAIVYIDDLIDLCLTRYLREASASKKVLPTASDISIRYCEIEFDPHRDNLKTLLDDSRLSDADIVIVDHQLFFQSTAEKKLTGKQLKVLLRALMPFCEVLIITQYAEVEGLDVIHKQDSSKMSGAVSYYDDNLLPRLKQAIEIVLGFEELAEDLHGSSDVSKPLIERVLLMVGGDNRYASLNANDINSLIDIFRELEDRVRK